MRALDWAWSARTGEASGWGRAGWEEEAPQALGHQLLEDLLECLTCEGLQSPVGIQVCVGLFLQACACQRERGERSPGCARTPHQMETAYNRHWRAGSPREVL